ncbi:hypothetical protein AB0I28_34670 [Phytomonospora sp. NPDC050363]|uniref:hypothetical protein n=1 Tax=Phytomonospora sp. NPDC050363 TaxID=3155642 RepID=UPI0033E2FBCF
MNEEVKNLLNGALSQPPPTAMDGESAVAAGRRRLGRRRYAAGGGALAGVVAVAVSISLAMNTVGGAAPDAAASATPSPSASQGGPPPTGQTPVDLPALDDGVEYYWADMNGEYTYSVATSAYSDAFWGWVESNLPGYIDRSDDVEHYGEEGPVYSEEDHVSGAHSLFKREEIELVEFIGGSGDDAKWTGYRLPAYTLIDADGWYPGVKLQLPGSTSAAESLGVRVWPKGGYTEGTHRPEDGSPDQEGVFDLIGCDDYEEDNGASADHSVEVTCQEGVNAEGERFVTSRTVSRLMPDEEGHDVAGADVSYWVVLYRLDGSAVELNVGTVRQYLDTDTAEPAISVEQLLALAEALPDVSVE